MFEALHTKPISPALYSFRAYLQVEFNFCVRASVMRANATDCVQVHVFDLAENKHEPLCDQKVVRKSKLTHCAFNNTQPLLLVGDDRGQVLCLKVPTRHIPLTRTHIHSPAGPAASIPYSKLSNFSA
jgi:hypothetical protein